MYLSFNWWRNFCFYLDFSRRFSVGYIVVLMFFFSFSFLKLICVHLALCMCISFLPQMPVLLLCIVLHGNFFLDIMKCYLFIHSVFKFLIAREHFDALCIGTGCKYKEQIAHSEFLLTFFLLLRTAPIWCWVPLHRQVVFQFHLGRGITTCGWWPGADPLRADHPAGCQHTRPHHAHHWG